MRRLALLLVTIWSSSLYCADGFAPFLTGGHAPPRRAFVWIPQLRAASQEGEVGSGSNWIERAFPVDLTGKDNEDIKKVEDYNLGINGVSFQTGPLSKRMFDAIMAKNGDNGMSDEIKRAYTLYTMDFTAKEATRAALKQNGLEMVVIDELEDQGLWGDLDSIQLLDMDTEDPVGPIYDSTQEAVDHWTPGQSFNFVVRQVPAKIRELSLDEILSALDPKGELRQQAKDAGMTIPDEEINSLRDLANDVSRRSECSPKEATTEINAFPGLDKRGYKVISAGALSRDSVNADGSENQGSKWTFVISMLCCIISCTIDQSCDNSLFHQGSYMSWMLWCHMVP